MKTHNQWVESKSGFLTLEGLGIWTMSLVRLRHFLCKRQHQMSPDECQALIEVSFREDTNQAKAVLSYLMMETLQMIFKPKSTPILNYQTCQKLTTMGLTRKRTKMTNHRRNGNRGPIEKMRIQTLMMNDLDKDGEVIQVPPLHHHEIEHPLLTAILFTFQTTISETTNSQTITKETS